MPPALERRRSVRLKGFDYSQAGMYFVTATAQNRKSLFGIIVDGKVLLNAFGDVVRAEWQKTAVVRPMVALDAYVIMPNHFHGIIAITDAGRATTGRGTARRATAAEQFGRPIPHSIPTIVRSFKSAVTRHINQIRKTPGNPVWQRNYYEHVIRDEDDLDNIRQYISNNPLQGELDRENPAARLLENKTPRQS